MPKKVQKKISKTSSRKSPSKHFQFKLVHLLILFIPLLIWYGYRQLVQKPEVNQVIEGGRFPVASSVEEGRAAMWQPITPPANCVSWFDGCNTCKVVNGVVSGCTMMACKTSRATPYCKLYADGSTPAPTTPSTPTPSPNATTTTAPIPSKYPLASGCYEFMPPCPPGKACPQVMRVVCPSPSPTSVASPISTVCTPKISSLYFKETCGERGFSSVTYQCNGGETKQYSDGCMDVPTIYEKIRGLCGDTCVTQVYPTKSIVPISINPDPKYERAR